MWLQKLAIKCATTSHFFRNSFNKFNDTCSLCKILFVYSKICLNQSLSKRPKVGFQDQLSLNAGQRYCRMFQGKHSAILSTSLSYHLSLRSLFCLLKSDRLRQVLLYHEIAVVKHCPDQFCSGINSYWHK